MSDPQSFNGANVYEILISVFHPCANNKSTQENIILNTFYSLIRFHSTLIRPFFILQQFIKVEIKFYILFSYS